MLLARERHLICQLEKRKEGERRQRRRKMEQSQGFNPAAVTHLFSTELEV